MTTRTLATNMHKAAKAVYRPLNKTTKHLPVLAHMLLRFHDGRIALTSHDLQEPATEYASAIWEGETWSTCVPARAFKDWLGVVAKSKEVLSLEFDEKLQLLTITTDPRATGTKSRTTFKCLDAMKFPHAPLQ